MNIEDVKRELEGLKAVMLEFHRSAANLDNYIRNIELELIAQENRPDQQYLELMIQGYRTYRGDYRRLQMLEKRENAAWEKLYNSIKEEEET